MIIGLLIYIYYLFAVYLAFINFLAASLCTLPIGRRIVGTIPSTVRQRSTRDGNHDSGASDPAGLFQAVKKALGGGPQAPGCNRERQRVCRERKVLFAKAFSAGFSGRVKGAANPVNSKKWP